MNAELQGKWMILAQKASAFGEEVKKIVKEVEDPSVVYYGNQAMTKLEEVMHRVGDMFTRLNMLSAEGVEAIAEKAMAEGKIHDFTKG